MKNFLDKTGRVALTILRALVAILFAVMVVVVFAQVYTRFLTDNSLVWSEELSRFSMIWMVFLASVLTFNSNDHIIVDALITFLKGTARAVLLIISKVMVLLYSVFIVIGATQFLPVVAIQTSTVLRWQMSLVYSIIPISMAAIGILCLRDIYVLVEENFLKSGREGSK
ncbi:MAG: TRAP transporter small permease [Clostridiales bacterium]